MRYVLIERVTQIPNEKAETLQGLNFRKKKILINPRQRRHSIVRLLDF